MGPPHTRRPLYQSQADYCRRQGLNAKTFPVRIRRVRDELPLGKDASLEIIPIQLHLYFSSLCCF